MPGESHGQRSLVGYSQGGVKEMDLTKQLTHTHSVLLIMYYFTAIYYFTVEDKDYLDQL